MSNGRYMRACVLILLTGLLLPLPPAASAQEAPRADRVEPPNWWPGHSCNPVRLLVYGKNLSDANVRSEKTGITIEGVKAGASDRYVFVDVRIDKSAKPGDYPLEIKTPGGTAIAPFELAAPLPRSGRFQGFSPDDIIYQIMVDRFANGDAENDNPTISPGMHDRNIARYYHGGDLQGIIGRLPYLKDLGVTTLWLTPVYDNVNHIDLNKKYDGYYFTDYHGYGPVDFYAVEEHFGDMDKLRELVDRAHKMGIKIVQGQIANHTGPQHPWVESPPTSTWLNGSFENHYANNWLVWTLQDPYATPETQEKTLDGWFSDILPDLNQDDEEVSRYIIQNTLWWIGMTGLDGIRQDTLPYVPRRFWRDWTAAIKREYPDFRIVGEVLNGNAATVSFFQGGKARFDGIDSGIDALFDFPLHGKILWSFANGNYVRDIPEILTQDALYENPNMLLTFLDLHDTSRFMHEGNADIEGMKLAYTFLMTARGIPMVYYGDELAMTGGGDPDNRRDFPGGWPNDERNAFTEEGRTPLENIVFDHLRSLIHLRNELEPLRQGKTINLLIENQIYAYARVHEGRTVVVVLNNGNESADIECPLTALDIPDDAVLHARLGALEDVRVSGNALQIQMPAREGYVYFVQ